MKCPKCGKEITEDSLFCEFCGTKIDTVDDQEIKKNRKKFLKVLVSTLIGLLALCWKQCG